MSILKKLSQRLSGLVSDRSETKKAGSRKSPLLVRPPRVKVLPLHDIHFTSSIKGLERVDRLANISVGGMALILPEDKKGPLSDLKIHGELSVSGRVFSVSAEIKHVIPGMIGCRFVGEYDAVAKAIEEYLKHELLGVRLQKVAEKFVKQDPRGQVNWFSDGGSNELYFVAGSSDIFEFHLSFLGHYIESDRHGGIRYGMLVPDATSSLGIKRANMLTLTNDIPQEALDAATTVLDNISQLKLKDRKLLQALLVY